MEKRHTISVLVENEFGVLARVAGLFSQKGYNIASLSVSETIDPTLSRMTIVTTGSDQVLAQILKQLNKLINVLKAEDLTKEHHLKRELFLMKIDRRAKSKEEIETLAARLKGRVVQLDRDAIILEVTGEDDKEFEEIVNELKPHGIVEIVRTGQIAIQKGRQILE